MNGEGKYQGWHYIKEKRDERFFCISLSMQIKAKLFIDVILIKLRGGLRKRISSKDLLMMERIKAKK